MPQVYTPITALIERLDSLYDDLRVAQGIFDIEKTEVVLTDVHSASKLLKERPELKVMALSDHPHFSEGQELLLEGIKGYANTFIHKLHLDQAIALINSGNIWLYPSFMQELINSTRQQKNNAEALLESLTSREQETAKALAHGKSNKEIAQALSITERTVKAHLSSIYEKTGIGDRTALALALKE